jgi:pimeloyl-ACP methyl ester carboxylesterase
VKSLEVISTIPGVRFYGLVFAAIVFAAGISTAALSAQAQNANPKATVVFVHGAYADGSSWSKVIPLLQAKGYTVVSVQNPLTSLADDVAATNRVINQQTEPVLLVGHSWAGVVITEAGNNPKVKGLVYVSGLAPDSGQSVVDVTAGFPPSAAPVLKDEGGFLSLSEAAYMKYFAPDLPPVEQKLLAATQVTWFNGCLTDKVTKAAWRDKPSWWVIGTNDQMVNPKLQEKMAANIKAKVTKVPTSHVAMLADPKAVTNVITSAADKVGSGKLDNGFVLNNSVTTENASYNTAPFVPVLSPVQTRNVAALTVRDVVGLAGVVPILGGEPPVKIIVDPPLADSLAQGRMVIQYRAENLRIEPVYGQAALNVSPRIGHIHITVDDAPWHWLDASGDPLVITGLTAGSHKVLIELVNASHQTLDYEVVKFEVPKRTLTANNPKADGFRSAPE